MSHRSDVAQFYCSTEEDLRFRLTFENLTLAGRTLRINIRERDTNTIKKTLNHGDLIISSSGVAGHPVDNDVYAAVLLADMAGWKLGEYEADLLDITGGATRIVAARITYDTPGELVYGVVGNQATVRIVDNQAIITATGGLGVAGPANSLTVPVDGVETVEPDQPAEVIIEGDPPSQTIRFKIPRGVDGHAGWSPVFAINADGERSVLRLAGWIGGEGDPPPHLSGSDPIYVGAGGFTTNIALAADLRGDKGDIGDQGDKGWTPLLAMVEDGARRVLQIQSWTGGEGSAPAAGGYLGPSGIVATAAEATDFRGEPGASVGPGSIGTDELADEAVTEEKIDPAYRATLATLDDLENFVFKDGGGAFIPARLTDARGDPTAGKIAFNTTTGEYEGGNGTEWVPIGGGGAINGTLFPTANLRKGIIFWHETWKAPFIYDVDANGGHWVSMFPVIDPSAFALKSAVPWEAISITNVSGSPSEVDIVGLPTTYRKLILDISGIAPATDDASLGLRLQTGGTTWHTSNGFYGYAGRMQGLGGGADFGSTVDSISARISLTRPGASQGAGNAPGERVFGEIDLVLGVDGVIPSIKYDGHFMRMDGTAVDVRCSGWLGTNGPITGVRLLWSAGAFQNVGSIKLMGLRA